MKKNICSAFCKVAQLVLFLVGMSALAAPSSEASYSWTHNNQDDWARMNKASVVCEEGMEQSPIDITGAQKGGDLPALITSYHKTAIELFRNSHTLQANVQDGDTIMIDGEAYKLVQFHFHRPSEHRIDGKAYPMELHLVHSNKEGKLAVVGVMLEDGGYLSSIQRILDYNPAQEGEENSRNVAIDVADLLPEEKQYYTYKGSLTTPPCNEGVTWIVMKTPIKIAAVQIAAFSKILGESAREIQPQNGRVIKKGN